MRDFLQRLVRNPFAMTGAVLLLAIVLAAGVAPFLYPADPLRIVGPALIVPFSDARFPLGTDALGRDMLAMILHGAGTTLAIGLCASLTALLIGVTVGAVAGYADGLAGNLSGRLIELFQTVPGLVVLMALISLFGAHLVLVVVLIGTVSWEGIARLTRAEVLSWKKRDFILACRTAGMGDARLLFGEILPNALASVIALSALSIAGAILIESGLSFLGLGDPNVATWGKLVGEGRATLTTAWYISALPGAAIVVTVFALSLLSEALNDALNPRLIR